MSAFVILAGFIKSVLDIQYWICLLGDSKNQASDFQCICKSQTGMFLSIWKGQFISYKQI